MTYQEMKAQMYIQAYAGALAGDRSNNTARMIAEKAVEDITSYFETPEDFDDVYQAPTPSV